MNFNISCTCNGKKEFVNCMVLNLNYYIIAMYKNGVFTIHSYAIAISWFKVMKTDSWNIIMNKSQYLFKYN